MQDNIRKAFQDIRTRLNDKRNFTGITQMVRCQVVMTEWAVDCVEGRLESLGILPKKVKESQNKERIQIGHIPEIGDIYADVWENKEGKMLWEVVKPDEV